MVKPGNTAKQGAFSEPGPGEASESTQLTLEEQEKDASDVVEEQPGSEAECGIWRKWTLLPASAVPSEKRGEDACPRG